MGHMSGTQVRDTGKSWPSCLFSIVRCLVLIIYVQCHFGLLLLGSLCISKDIDVLQLIPTVLSKKFRRILQNYMVYLSSSDFHNMI